MLCHAGQVTLGLILILRYLSVRTYMLPGDDAWKLEETKNMNCPMFSPFVADAEIKAFSPCTKHSISGLSENVCAFFSLNPSRTSFNILTDLAFPSLPPLLFFNYLSSLPR